MTTQQSYLRLQDAAEVGGFDFADIPEDPFWNASDSKKAKLHRIHAYPAKFPAFITTKALSYASCNSALKVDPLDYWQDGGLVVPIGVQPPRQITIEKPALVR